VAPIRGLSQGTYTGTSNGQLYYDILNKEILYNSSSSKTFVINHPIKEEKYLIHACLEGPEAGVYYRGKGEITNNKNKTIFLPDYVEKITTELTIQITHIYDGTLKMYSTSEVKENKFTVFGENGKFFWIVHGKRCSIEVEPDKLTTIIKGTGPYKWI
jgi:hypothetical protein